MRITFDKTFVSRDLAEAFVSQYLKEYDPMGYDTYLVIFEPEKEGEPYRVHGSRYASAD